MAFNTMTRREGRHVLGISRKADRHRMLNLRGKSDTVGNGKVLQAAKEGPVAACAEGLILEERERRDGHMENQSTHQTRKGGEGRQEMPIISVSRGNLAGARRIRCAGASARKHVGGELSGC